MENDGYASIQIGFGDLKAQVNKPMKGHFAKQILLKEILREFRVEDTDAYNVGDLIKADVFAGDKIDVTGTSKGKGWAGVIKRWNFSRLKESHGTGQLDVKVVLLVLALTLQEYLRAKNGWSPRC